MQPGQAFISLFASSQRLNGKVLRVSRAETTEWGMEQLEMFRVSQIKIPQHENHHICVYCENIFAPHFPRSFSAEYFVILLRLVIIWRSGTASDSVFDFFLVHIVMFS